MDIPENAVILSKEPLEGLTPYNVRQCIFKEWWSFQQELYTKIIVILKEENAAGKTKHKISNKGLHYVILPFMERNGYRDGAGWWVKK